MTVQNDQKKNAKSKAFDHDVIRDLANLLEETNLAEIEIEHEGLRVRVARHLGSAGGAAVASVLTTAQPSLPTGNESTTKPELAQHAGTISSPMVGTAYLSPKPGDPPFIKVGDHVTEGQTLMIIEAMKTMNPIPATTPGTVLKVLVPDAHPVEYGEPLLIIE